MPGLMAAESKTFVVVLVVFNYKFFPGLTECLVILSADFHCQRPSDNGGLGSSSGDTALLRGCVVTVEVVVNEIVEVDEVVRV